MEVSPWRGGTGLAGRPGGCVAVYMCCVLAWGVARDRVKGSGKGGLDPEGDWEWEGFLRGSEQWFQNSSLPTGGGSGRRKKKLAIESPALFSLHPPGNGSPLCPSPMLPGAPFPSPGGCWTRDKRLWEVVGIGI